MVWKRLLLGAVLLLCLATSTWFTVSRNEDNISLLRFLLRPETEPPSKPDIHGSDDLEESPSDERARKIEKLLFPARNLTWENKMAAGDHKRSRSPRRLSAPKFYPKRESLPSNVESPREKKLHDWAKKKFESAWNRGALRSCVDVCGNEKSPPVRFTLPNRLKCSSSAFCTYSRLQTHSNRMDKISSTASAICTSGNTASCPRASKNDCTTFSWTNRRVTLNLSGEKISQNILDLIFRNPRSFRVQSSLVSHIPNYLVVVSFYLPNTIYKDKCNQLYCIYSDIKSKMFEYDLAIVGDASFTYCPRPNFQTSNQTMVQLAYSPNLMSIPIPLIIESPVTNLPFVSLSICSIVRKEGRNLVEWIEFHRMMGYERFILYDNNPVDDPDEVMNMLINHYNGTVIRKDWKVLHSQTEAYTDCINRYGKTTKWMSLIDVDEFIVPDPKFANVLSVLENVHNSNDNVHIEWTTFGPCGNKTRGKYDLMMELCHYTTKSSSSYPKSTVKADMAAGMQNYGPHYVRMKKDIGGLVASLQTKATLLRNYHYRYRTYPEYMERRKGPRAGRALEWSADDLNREWKEGIKFGQRLKDDDNWILRYHDELKERTTDVIDRLV